jgi:hypothetical protein
MGNITNYVTSQGCSEAGLSVGCPVGGPDGWYSDGLYSYYVVNGAVDSINYDPCATPPPPPPPPPSYTWYAVDLASGSPGKGGSACSNAQYGYTSGYYMNSTSFASSTLIALYNDGSGAPFDDYYSDGNVVRYSTNGGLGSSTICDQS